MSMDEHNVVIIQSLLFVRKGLLVPESPIWKTNFCPLFVSNKILNVKIN